MPASALLRSSPASSVRDVSTYADRKKRGDANASGAHNESRASRAARGRPIVQFTLDAAVVADLESLAERLSLSKSAVVALAIVELKKRK